MTATTAPRQTAADRRLAFVLDAYAPVDRTVSPEAVAALPVEVWVGIAQRLADEGPALGRTDRWRAACAAALDLIAEDPTDLAHVRWAVTQANVWLAHAID